MDTTRKLTAIDFMMMDVHRELDEENFHPETLLDKSARPQQEEHSDDPGVGVSHEEVPAQRCYVCFGPYPCAQHHNVEELTVVTKLDVSPTSMLAKAHEANLKEVVIVGILQDGREYFASSVADGAPAMYHLQRGIYKLNQIVDGDHGEEVEPPGASA